MVPIQTNEVHMPTKNFLVIHKDLKKEGRVITSLNLTLGADCGDSCVGVNSRCMEKKHTNIQHINCTRLC